jgi:hypothetical protein
MKILAVLFLCFISSSSAALAQGYLNAPVYATGVVEVQATSSITTQLKQAYSPGNFSVLAQGPITSWTILLPFPAFDGQLVYIGCPGGAVTTLTIRGNGNSIGPNSPTTCAQGNLSIVQFFRGLWTTLSNVLNPDNASNITTGALNGIPIGQQTQAPGAFSSLTGTPISPSLNVFPAAQNLLRVPVRTFIGADLNANDGGDFFHIQAKDWLEGLVQASTSVAQQATLGNVGTPTAIAGGVRTSDNIGGFSFAISGFGINDDHTAQSTLITDYREGRTFPGAGTTQVTEFDAIGQGGPSPHLDPYRWQSQLPASINQWYSNGRPDILNAFIGGTITAGDVITLNATTGFTGAPQSVSYTVLAGDTNFTIAARLAAEINANTIFKALNQPIYAEAINNDVSIGNSPPSIVWTEAISGAATETVILSFGTPQSLGVGFINNCNENQTCGSYSTGIMFDHFALIGTDGSDTATGYGEAISLARLQSFDWYSSDGLVKARISSAATTADSIGSQILFNDTGILFGTTGGGGWFQTGPSGTSFFGPLSASAGLFIPGSGGTPVPVTFGAADSGGTGFRQLLIPN